MNDETEDYTEKLKRLVIGALEDMKAKDIRVLEVGKLASFTDLMIVATGTSTRQVKAMAEKVVLAAKAEGIQPLGVEAGGVADWVLVDLSDVIVHMMLQETRDFYNLEKLWETPVAEQSHDV